MPDNPEQLMAFLRGETNDPGDVHAIRGGIRWQTPTPPSVEKVCAELTKDLLRPELEAAGVEDPGRYRVVCDTTPILHPTSFEIELTPDQREQRAVSLKRLEVSLELPMTEDGLTAFMDVFRQAEEKRAAEIAACPKHLWVIEVEEDEEDGHYLRCELCPAGEADLYDDPWELMDGEVAPGIGVEDLATLKRRPRSFPINIEVRWVKVGWERPEWEAEILVSPRTS